MVQRVKVLVAKPEDWGSIPGSHMLEGENQVLQGVLWPPQVHCGMCVYKHIHICKRKHGKSEIKTNKQMHHFNCWE